MFTKFYSTKNKRKQIIYLLVLLIAYSGTIVANEQSFTLVTASYPPYNYQENGVKGLNIEIIRAAFNQQGIKVKATILPFSRALSLAKKGKADGITLWHTRQREQWFAFSQAFTRSELVFYKRKSLLLDTSHLDNLAPFTVGTVQDYAYPDNFLSHPNITRAPVLTDQQNIKKLVFNRIQIAVIDHNVANYLMNQLFPKQQILFESAGVLKHENYYLAISKLTPKYQQKLAAFNQGLDKIKQNGELATIIQKYQ